MEKIVFVSFHISLYVDIFYLSGVFANVDFQKMMSHLEKLGEGSTGTHLYTMTLLFFK